MFYLITVTEIRDRNYVIFASDEESAEKSAFCRYEGDVQADYEANTTRFELVETKVVPLRKDKG